MSERKTITDFIQPARSPDEKRPSVIIVAGRDIGRQYFLSKGDTLIGRDEDCAIRLNDSRASRRHAKISGDPHAQAGPHFSVIDLDSTNGTFLNERRITEAMLADGDKIHIGYTLFKYAIRDIVEIEYENKIYRMATTDALTGLSSRDHFLQQYNEVFHRSQRYHRPFSLMMADIDDFKSVNDTYGHPVGDRVLEALGRTVMEVIRYEDFPARYGGEEFVVLMPETSPENARRPAERLRRKIETLVFEAEGKCFSVTVSIGIAGYPDHAETMNDLMKSADNALYEAKKMGKNQVRLFQGGRQ
ncbi:GGDEF domain-containing protein [Candidatus Poribacteria bacterium]|nr:GGDEF domain-containing protein [Candidatus Poribacteria bacterium]